MKPLPLLFALGLSCATTPAAELPSAAELKQRLRDRLTRASSAQWTVELTVEKDDNGLYSQGFPERQTWHFKVRGKDRAYWTSDVGQEGWYREPMLRLRAGGMIRDVDFGPEEGACIVLALLKGGLVGWQLVHVSWGFESDRLSSPAWDVVDGRRAIVVDSDFKLNTPGSTDPEVTGGRLWIDAETGLPVQRTYARFATGGDAPKAFVVRERYSGWTLDAALPDSAFTP